ncbi:DUF5362 family protein [Prosthecobacter sp.]|uniref:DUF5362 family protein n=1 Tax=Prosthecobacter sp. TaxID=1965333 RepID=UPI00378417F8
MSAYLVTRDGQELGSFEASQIQEGLKTGFFLASDWAWREGMSGWQGVSEIVPDGGAPKAAAVTVPTISSPLSAPVRQPAALKKPDGTNPYAAPTANTLGTPLGAVPVPVITELIGTKPWVRLISVLMWIFCALFLLSIVGNLLLGVVSAGALAQNGKGGLGFGMLVFMMVFFGITALLIIYPTLKLSNYASGISRLAETKSYGDLTTALAEQRRFWKFYGIITLIYVIIGAFFFLLMLAGIGIGSMVH